MIAEADYLEARDGPLQSPMTILRGPSSIPLSVSGKFRGKLQNPGDKVTCEDIFVIKDLQNPLLGSPAIESLSLVMRVEPINTTDHPMTKDVMQRFPSLFGKLGKLQGSYHIKIKESAVPFSLNIPRRVAIPLLPKVQMELE